MNRLVAVYLLKRRTQRGVWTRVRVAVEVRRV